MEIILDFSRIIHALLNKMWLIFLTSLLFLIVAIVTTLTPKPDSFEARTTIYCEAAGSYGNMVETADVMQSYLGMIHSLKLSQRVALMLGVEAVDAFQIQGMTRVVPGIDSPILTIYAVSENPNLAVACANAVSEAFIFEIENAVPGRSIKILDPAIYAYQIYNGMSDRLLVRTSYAVCGMFLTVVIIVFREIIKTNRKSVRKEVREEALEIRDDSLME